MGLRSLRLPFLVTEDQAADLLFGGPQHLLRFFLRACAGAPAVFGSEAGPDIFTRKSEIPNYYLLTNLPKIINAFCLLRVI